MLQLSTVGGICNARCVFCPLEDPLYYSKNDAKTGIMSFPLFAKLIDEAKTIPEFNVVVMTGLGETLLDPHLDTRIKYIRAARNDWETSVFTNGFSLSPPRFDRLADAGLQNLIISLNATRSEEHHATMKLGLGAFDKISRFADYAIGSGRMRVVVNAIVSLDRWTGEQVKTFKDRWGDAAHMTWENNWAGANRTISEYPAFKPNETCPRAIDSIYITWNGKVSMCVLDPMAKHGFGDASVKTIREVYNSEEYVRFRTAHNENRADEFVVCRNCTRN